MRLEVENAHHESPIEMFRGHARRRSGLIAVFGGPMAADEYTLVREELFEPSKPVFAQGISCLVNIKPFVLNCPNFRSPLIVAPYTSDL